MSGTESSCTLSRSKKNTNLTSEVSTSHLIRLRSDPLIKMPPDSTFEEQNHQKQLMKEIEDARQTVFSYQIHLEVSHNQRVFVKNPQTIVEMRKMEKIIISKDQQLNEINEQIRMLRSAPDHIRGDAAKTYKNFKDAQMFKLADEVIQQKSDLISCQRIHKEKCVEIAQKKELMNSLFSQYEESCRQLCKIPVSYQQFRQWKIDKKKDRFHSKFKRNTNKVSVSPEYGQKKYPVSMDLRQAQERNEKAEAALKIFRKKHIQQLNQLNGKVQFLRDEHQELQIKLNEKQKQLKSAENRFSKYRSGTSTRKPKIKINSQPE